MPEITLVAEPGRRPGSSDARRLRTEGKIPGVVYGHGLDPLPVAVEARALRAALNTEAGLNALLELQVAGASHLTLARELQRHPVRGTVQHVDFLIVRRDEVIAADVHITLVGDAIQVHRNDGVVEQLLFTLPVHAIPGKIPNVLEVDISKLDVGDTIRVSDLTLPDGVTTELDPESGVVVGQVQVIDESLEPEGEPEAAAAPVAEDGEG